MMLSFVVARTSSFCFCSCSAMSELGVVFHFGLMPSFESRILRVGIPCIKGMRPWNTVDGSHPKVSWYVVLLFMTAILTYLCHIEGLLPVDIFRAILIEACVLSRIPIVCACFVDAWLIWISSIGVISEL